MPLKPDPLGIPRNPLAVYLLLLAFVSGLGMLLGPTTAGAVERTLPPLIANLWGGILFLGSGATLAGMFWQGDIRFGLLMKRTGMFAVGVAAIVYGMVIAVAVGLEGLFAGGITSGFGVVCFLQYLRVNRRIHEIVLLTKAERKDDA
jgi:hypothetical protein